MEYTVRRKRSNLRIPLLVDEEDDYQELDKAAGLVMFCYGGGRFYERIFVFNRFASCCGTGMDSDAGL